MKKLIIYSCLILGGISTPNLSKACYIDPMGREICRKEWAWCSCGALIVRCEFGTGGCGAGMRGFCDEVCN